MIERQDVEYDGGGLTPEILDKAMDQVLAHGHVTIRSRDTILHYCTLVGCTEGEGGTPVGSA